MNHPKIARHLLLLPTTTENLSPTALGLAFILFFTATIAAFLQLTLGWTMLNFSNEMAAVIQLLGAWMSCSLLARLHLLGVR